jgi:hypothetical protein
MCSPNTLSTPAAAPFGRYSGRAISTPHLYSRSDPASAERAFQPSFGITSGRAMAKLCVDQKSATLGALFLLQKSAFSFSDSHSFNRPNTAHMQV